MARKYEGSPEDLAEDAIGMKATGLAKKAYESSARDRKEDAAGQGRIKVNPHFRKHPGPRKPKAPPTPMLAPAPGESNDGFDGGM